MSWVAWSHHHCGSHLASSWPVHCIRLTCLGPQVQAVWQSHVNLAPRNADSSLGRNELCATWEGSGLSPETDPFLGSRARQRDPERKLGALCVLCCGEAGVTPGRCWMAWPWLLGAQHVQRCWSGHSRGEEVIVRRCRDRPDPKLMV